MVNNSTTHVRSGPAGLVTAYLGLAAATVLALIVLRLLAPRFTTQEAWVHTIIVAVFAVLLGLRTRAARRGSARAARAVMIIAAVVLVANVVEAVIPGLFPIWMRIVMVITAVLMAGVIILGRRRRMSTMSTSTVNQ